MTLIQKTVQDSPVTCMCREGSKDDHVFGDIFRQNHYFFPHDMKGLVVVDVGAHIGSASLLAASRGATVYAFEPMKESFSILEQNIKNNPFCKIIARNVGLGTPGKRLLNINKNADCNSLHSLEDPENGIGTEEIEVISLAEALKDVPHIDILKLDCEGAEWEIFPEIIAGLHKRIPYFVGEIHPLYKLDGDEPEMYERKKVGTYVYTYTHL